MSDLIKQLKLRIDRLNERIDRFETWEKFATDPFMKGLFEGGKNQADIALRDMRFLLAIAEMEVSYGTHTTGSAGSATKTGSQAV